MRNLVDRGARLLKPEEMEPAWPSVVTVAQQKGGCRQDDAGDPAGDGAGGRRPARGPGRHRPAGQPHGLDAAARAPPARRARAALLHGRRLAAGGRARPAQARGRRDRGRHPAAHRDRRQGRDPQRRPGAGPLPAQLARHLGQPGHGRAGRQGEAQGGPGAQPRARRAAARSRRRATPWPSWAHRRSRPRSATARPSSPASPRGWA